MKWPIVRKAIVRKLFIPYLIFLASFAFYTIVIFENLHPHPPYVDPNAEPELPVLDTNATDGNSTMDPASLYYLYPEFEWQSYKAGGGSINEL